MSKILGIDTSNYTTSAAILDTESMEIKQSKMLLPVKHGEKGLRQSDAVFHHTKQIPLVLKDLLSDFSGELDGIGVSVKPRPVSGSYMPCFLTGQAVAESIGLVQNIRPDFTSHQTGHILAALYSCGKLDLIINKIPFIAFHVSGGTTDMLLCRPDEKEILNIELIGTALDLNAGQVIDRTGVMLGLGFPCGEELEKLAEKSSVAYKVKPTMKGMNCCLSGIENQCRKLYEAGESSENIAGFCIASISAAIYKMTVLAADKYDEMPFIYAGGVMSNKIISGNLKRGYFAEPDFSKDNAAGAAVFSAVRKGLI